MFPPTFAITRDPIDHSLQWQPAAGSVELADALSYHFPEEQSLRVKMQRAILEFLRVDCQAISTGSSIPSEMSPAKIIYKRPSESRIIQKQMVGSTPKEARGTMVQWNAKTGRMVGKRTRRRYDPVRRQRVAENRGNACATHRKAKTECNQITCPGNKLNRNLQVATETEDLSISFAEACLDDQSQAATNEVTSQSVLQDEFGVDLQKRSCGGPFVNFDVFSNLHSSWKLSVPLLEASIRRSDPLLINGAMSELYHQPGYHLNPEKTVVVICSRNVLIAKSLLLSIQRAHNAITRSSSNPVLGNMDFPFSIFDFELVPDDTLQYDYSPVDEKIELNTDRKKLYQWLTAKSKDLREAFFSTPLILLQYTEDGTDIRAKTALILEEFGAGLIQHRDAPEGQHVDWLETSWSSTKDATGQQLLPIDWSAFLSNYEDPIDWILDLQSPTFSTATFKNSHYNSAHFNNPAFQPEEWRPDME